MSWSKGGVGSGEGCFSQTWGFDVGVGGQATMHCLVEYAHCEHKNNSNEAKKVNLQENTCMMTVYLYNESIERIYSKTWEPLK